MRKKIFMMLIAVCALLIAASIPLAAEQERPYETRAFGGGSRMVHPVDETKAPAGFRDLKWGDVLSDVTGMEIDRFAVKNDVYVEHIREGDKMSIGDVPLKSITYYALDGKLAKVVIWVGKSGSHGGGSSEQWASIKQTLFNAYGQIPNATDWGECYLWVFRDVAVVLEQSFGDPCIEYTYLPSAAWKAEIEERQKKEREEQIREQGAKGVSDL